MTCKHCKGGDLIHKPEGPGLQGSSFGQDRCSFIKLNTNKRLHYTTTEPARPFRISVSGWLDAGIIVISAKSCSAIDHKETSLLAIVINESIAFLLKASVVLCKELKRST